MDILSSDTLECMRLCVKIASEKFEKLLAECVSCILLRDDDELSQYPSEELKQQFTDCVDLKRLFPAICTALLEICKVNCSKSQVEMLLEDAQLTKEQKDLLLKIYADNRQMIRARLSKISTPFPHLCDVDWRLDYNIKNKETNKVMELRYNVAFKTDGGDANDVLLTCNRNQLQDLVGKLKEAVKAVEKTSQ